MIRSGYFTGGFQVIQVSRTFDPEIQNCGTFNFRGFHHITEDRQQLGGARKHRRQNELIAKAKVLLEELKVLACEVEVTVGSKDGNSVLRGAIKAYTPGSLDKVENIVQALTFLAAAFSNDFPDSSFTLAVSQSITITHVDGVEKHPN